MKKYMVVLIAIFLLFSGCKKAEDQKEREKMIPRLEQMEKEVNRLNAKEEQIKAEVAADRTVLHSKAISAFKKGVEQSWGTTIANKAKYEVVKVEDYGKSKWIVHGLYHGVDDKGKSLEADWTVTFEVFGGNLQTVKTSLGTRRYK